MTVELRTPNRAAVNTGTAINVDGGLSPVVQASET